NGSTEKKPGYLQTMLGLSFARSRHAWRCFCAAAASAFLVVAAVTAPFGVTAGATVLAVCAGAVAIVVVATRPWVCQSDMINSQASLAALPTVCVALVPRMSPSRFATWIWLLLRRSPRFCLDSRFIMMVLYAFDCISVTTTLV